VLNTPSLSHHEPVDGSRTGWWDFGQGGTAVMREGRSWSGAAGVPGKASSASGSQASSVGEGRGAGGLEGKGRGQILIGGQSRGGRRS
jgi:hypothetical protein